MNIFTTFKQLKTLKKLGKKYLFQTAAILLFFNSILSFGTGDTDIYSYRANLFPFV